MKSGKQENKKLTQVDSSSPNTSEIENVVRSQGREDSDKIDQMTTQIVSPEEDINTIRLEVDAFDNQIYERKGGEDTPVAPYNKRSRVSQPSNNNI